MACTATLSAIACQCGKTLGGIKHFYVINRDKVSITVSSNSVTDIDLTAAEPATGDGWIDFCFKKGTANVVITGNADDAGRNNSFTTVATLNFMKQEAAKRVSLQAICETSAYAVWEDNNGKRWLMGYDDAIAANVNGETGSAYTDNNMYTLVVTDNSLELPMEITMSDADWAAILDANL